MIFKLTKRCFLSCVAGIIVVSLGFHYLISTSVELEHIQRKYHYLVIQEPFDNKSVVIGPHVVNYAAYENTVVGLILPTYMFNCGKYHQSSPTATPKLVGFEYDLERRDIEYFPNIDEFKRHSNVVASGLMIRSIDELTLSEPNGHLWFNRGLTSSEDCDPILIDLKSWTGDIGDNNFDIAYEQSWLFSYQMDRELIRQWTEAYWQRCIDNSYRRSNNRDQLCEPVSVNE